MMPRVQAIVARDGRVLMVQHRHRGERYWCLPGGALEPGESPEQGALRELREECNVDGAVVSKTSCVLDVYAGETHTFLVDIGDQPPSLGHDPEFAAAGRAPILVDVRWLRLSEIPERDRAFLWAAGLLGVDGFLDEVEGWRGEISYPGEERAGRPADVDVYVLLDELRAIARNGLHFAQDPYDRERYRRLMDLATRTYGELLHVPAGRIRRRFLDEIGYVTPKVGADAAIFNDSGEILLMERVDTGTWCLPCGWVEPNERPVDTVVREVREETGLEVEVERLVGVFSRRASAEDGPHAMIAVVHLCRVGGGELTLSHEGTDLRYWPIEAVPDWSGNHERYARAAHAVWSSERWLPAVSD